MENQHGFTESSFDKDGKKNMFFFLGPENNWKNLLDKGLVNEINKEFENEMRDLGYIKE